MHMLTLACLAALPLGFATCALAGDGTDTPADGGTPPMATPASTPGGWQMAFNAGAQSDYLFRGISQTNHRPSGFAGLDLSWDGAWYAGTWTSNVDFSPSGDTRTRQEIDLYGGWRPTLAGVNLDLGYIYYDYLHQPSHLRESYAETYLRGSHAFGATSLGAAAYYSPNFPGSSSHALYGEVNLTHAFNATWSASAAVGRQSIADGATRNDGSLARFAYNTWNVGATWAINDHTSLDLRYWDTNTHDTGSIYRSRLVMGVKATF
ncbi:TorF family putative porin [Dyella sp. C9]|uniref:TorF family putative porin n=1 Tax=Dyella sp. C9 TaxID=2202154 RepID=UPI0013003662|nr:TorF family putative porin [Dyella sp. C9]